MRLVLDTNTAVSGLLWNGAPSRLIAAAEERRATLVSSAALLSELQGVLSRDKFRMQLRARGLDVSDVFDGFAGLVEIVIPADIGSRIAQDPPDDQVLAAALAGSADYIVSGDGHLLNLKEFHGIPIVSAAIVATLIDDRTLPAR